MDLPREFHNDRKRAKRANIKLVEIVASDVFDDPSARFSALAVKGNHRTTQ